MGYPRREPLLLRQRKVKILYSSTGGTESSQASSRGACCCLFGLFSPSRPDFLLWRGWLPWAATCHPHAQIDFQSAHSPPSGEFSPLRPRESSLPGSQGPQKTQCPVLSGRATEDGWGHRVDKLCSLHPQDLGTQVLPAPEFSPSAALEVCLLLKSVLLL